MAGGRLIGEAYIVVYPNTDEFAAQLETKLETATKSLKPDVNVTPTLDKTAAGKLKTALNGLAANVKITPELDQARLGTIKTALDAALGDYRVDVKANLSAAQVAALKKLLDTELNGGGGTKVNLNTGPASDELQVLIDRSEDVKAQLGFLRANIDDTQAEAALAKLQVQAAALEKSLEAAAKSGTNDLLPLEATVLAIEAGFERINAQKIDINTRAASDNLLNLADQAGELRITLANFRADINSAQGLAKLSALEAEAVKLSRSLTFAPNDADLAPFQAGLDSILAKYDTLQKAQKKEDDELNKQAGLWASIGLNGPGSLIHITDILNASIPGVKLFDGALGDMYTALSKNNAELPKLIDHLINTATSAHLTAEAAVEFVAIWGPALIGLSAFALAAAPALKDIATQMRNISVVTESTGVQFQNLAIGQSKLAQAVKPEVMQLFGEYLLAAGQSGDHLATVLKAVGDVLDKFGAEIVQALQNPGTSKFLDKAASDIQGLGVAFTQVGRIIGDLLQDVPGYAEILLKLGDAALTMGANVIGAINPVIAAFLKIHGAVLYLGLATTAMAAFARGATNAFVAVSGGGEKVTETTGILNGLGVAAGNLAGAFSSKLTSVKNYTTAIADLAKTDGPAAAGSLLLGDAVGAAPFGPAGLAAVGLAAIIGGVLYLSLKSSATAADALNAALQKQINASNVVTVQSNLAEATLKTRDAINQQTAAIANQLGSTKQLQEAGLSSVQIARLQAGEIANASSEQEKYSSALGQYAGQSATAAIRTDALEKQYGSLADVSQLLTLANVKQTDTAQANTAQWSQDEIQIKATAAAYGLLGQQSGAAGNQLDTLTIATGTVTKAVQTLVSAEQQWLGIITGGDNAFDTFEQGLATLSDTLTGKMTPATITSTTASTKATASVSKLAGTSDTARTSIDKLGGTSTTTGSSLTKLAGGGTDATTSLSKTAKGGSDVATSLSKTTKSTTDYINALSTGTSTTTKAATSADTLTVKIGNLKEVFSTAGAAMNGTSAASLAVRQAFDQQITQAGTLYGSLQTLAAASGDNTTANTALAKSGKDIVAQLLPLAAGSKTATAEVYALAQIVGYTGKDSFADLATWVGRVKDAEGDLNTNTETLTVSSATLSQAAKNLSGALQDEVSAIQSKGLLATADFTTAQNNLIDSLQQTGGALTTLSVTDIKAYYAQLLKAGLSTQDATQYTDALLQKLHVVPGSISDINKQLDAMSTASSRNDQLTQALTNAQATLTSTLANAESQGKLTAGAVDTLSTAVETNQGHIDNSKTAFEQFAGQLGISKANADDLWTSLKQVTGTYGATVNVKLAGGGTITASVTAEAALVAASQQAAVASAAAAQSPHIIPLGAVGGIMTPSGFAGRELFAGGGTVRGHGPAGKDSVPAILAPGEMVIPTTHVAAHAAQARREGIPGMASGGVANGPGSFTGSPFVTSALAKYSEPGYATAVMNVVSTQARETTLKATVEAMKEVLAAIAAQGTPGNVQSYKGIVDTVLGLLGQPVSDDTIVLSQMATESGGNPTAVNNSDSNAIAGTPSTGLMQVIGPTFAAYAGPFANTGPFLNGVSTNPEANIYAGINYAIHRYGSQWTSVLGQGHGYSAGGTLNEPVFGIGKHTGTPYSFAEHGPERFAPASGAQGPDSGGGISQQQFAQLIQEVRNLNQTQSQQGRSYARTLNGSAAQGLRRGYFATSG